MSGRKKKSKIQSPVLNSASPPPPVQRQRRRGGGNHDAIRSSLTLIIEMLQINPDEYNESTLKHNVVIAVRRLEKIVEKLN
jgi:hypothetical protein